MTQYFILPGFGNSGPDHWQTWLEKMGNQFRRVQQEEWNAPHCTDWIAQIDAELDGRDLSKVVLIGHSLACSTIAHWAKRYQRKIRGAVLVAPSDVEAPGYTFPTVGFDPLPLDRLSFPTIVVASQDDQWVTMDRARFFAHQWGSRLIDIGKAGHINVASGYGPWPQILELIRSIE